VIAAAPPPLPVGVGLREWSVAMYRTRARPGAVKLNLTNFGEDAHDLQVFGPGGYRSARSPEVAPFGGRETLRVTLRRTGTYRLLCMKPGHAEQGMRATLRVRRPPAR
jgi:plastocyanin